MKASAILLAASGSVLWAGTNLWTSLGSDGGGSSVLTIDPLNSSTVYAGTNGGAFKSTDAGASWAATGAGIVVTLLGG